MKGVVLDVGGKKNGRRGSFVPPIKNVSSWEYLNRDPSSNPDYLCEVEEMSLPNEVVDTIVMTEVMEYLPNPQKALKEIHRIAKHGAYILISIPFLCPVHGDKLVDRARYTPVMLRELFTMAKFKVCTVEPMGSVGAVIFDTIRIALTYARKTSKNRFWAQAFHRTSPIFLWLDRKTLAQKEFINTGYFVVLLKE